LKHAINFLADLADSSGYSAVNTARIALSSIISLSDGTIFGKHPLVKRFLKGVFEKKPALPRYSSIWVVNIVFDYLKQWPEDIQLKDLTFKLTMLLALLTGQRCQTLHLLNIDNMQLLKDKCIFYVNNAVKQTSARKHVKPLELL
jgi:hypothetical protein